MVIAGYAVWGLLIFLFALTDNLRLAIGLAFGQGVANMVFVIPSQTLFQERTPPALMGRVVGFRFALVFGSMTIAMAARVGARRGLRTGAGHRALRAGDGGGRAGRAARPGRARCVTGSRRTAPGAFGTLAPAPRPMTEPAARSDIEPE